MPSLTVLRGPDKGLGFQTREDELAVVLGRASDAISLTDYTVSRRHAEVRLVGGGWQLVDLNSANGTYLNGKRVERPVRLKHGDQIRLGGTLLVWSGKDENVPGTGFGDRVAASDLVELDAGSKRVDASIVGSVASMDDSMILASPAAAEAVRAWRVLSTLLEAVGAVPSPDELLERVMDILFEEVPADQGFILMQDPTDGTYKPYVVRHGQDTKDKIRTSRTIVDHVIEHREGLLCSNAMSDERFGGGHRSGSIQAMGLQSVICVPIISREDVLGVIHLDSVMSSHIYTEEQLRLVTAIGRMAALAVENARLVSERMRTERLAATGETVAALSHYIKNIVQGMMSGSDVVEMGLKNQSLANMDQGWQIVRRNVDKIMSLTMNMLAFAKERKPRLESAQVNALVKDVLELVRRRADDKGVLLLSELEDPMPAIPMDRDGIHQVVLNIVANAIDAVPKSSGAVNIKSSYDPQRAKVTITVGDNGPGIPDKMRERVFDAFYSTKGHGGTGLGLAVAHKIVDEHAGMISVKSIASEGTLVRVTLPAIQAQEIDSEATRGPSSS
ncbi:MAG: ATP-binding protein [Phycisphaerae bacterium]